MKDIYIWEIIAKNTPLIKKKCNHCNCNQFYCSEKFRMNSQKKNIDVWLIYRCLECDSTYNLSILSRTKSELISKDLFHKFSENDATTAWEYAFSTEIGRKNNIELDFSSVEYEIQHEELSIIDILNSENETIVFKIKCHHEFNIKLSLIIRRCLALSANQLNCLIKGEVIYSNDIQTINNRKVKNGDIIQINKEKLNIYTDKTIIQCKTGN